MRLHGVGGTIRVTRAVRYFLVSSFIFIYLQSHIRHVRALTNVRVLTNVQVLANVRVQTAVVLPALLAGVVGLCLVCLVRGLCCCRLLVALGPSVFSLFSLMLCTFFFLFFLLFMSSGERGRDPVPFRCNVSLAFYLLSLLYCAFSL